MYVCMCMRWFCGLSGTTLEELFSFCLICKVGSTIPPPPHSATPSVTNPRRDDVIGCHAITLLLLIEQSVCCLLRAVDFVPSLPRSKLAAVSALGYGLLNKVQCCTTTRASFYCFIFRVLYFLSYFIPSFLFCICF